jgi:3-oxoacyl-[acyl-carrier-protein] synthase-3
MKYSKIISTSRYLPGKIITNAQIEAKINTSDEWITQRTGIKQRYIAEDESTGDMASKAAALAIEKLGLNKEQIDIIIVATTTADRTFPSTACLVQAKLEIRKSVIAFDMQAACSGFLYGIVTADSMIKAGLGEKAIVIGVDKMSCLLDWQDRSTCVLFGDGAGAVIIEKTSEQGRILDAILYSDGSLHDLINTNGGISTTQTSGHIRMKGQELFRHAVSKMSESIFTILKRNNLTADDIAMIIPHQANYRILQAVADKTNINYNKFAVTVDKHANTSAASIAITLDCMIEEKRIKSGDYIILEALGAGLTWGACLIKL